VFDVTIPWGPPFDATIARTIADLAVPGNESVGRSIEG
jgi:hypothetical protein